MPTAEGASNRSPGSPLPSLESLVAAAQCTERVPGIAVAVVVDSRLVATAAAGQASLHPAVSADPMMTCCWFSMTKVATATAAMILVDEGRLDLDAPVGRYLGDIWPPDFAAARVRHLLSHSSGLSNPLPLRWVHLAGSPRPDQHAFLSRLLAHQRKPKFEPGTRAAYTNVGFLALGEVIAAVVDEPYVTWMSANVLRRLGMEGTAFSWTDVGGRPAATGYVRLAAPLTPFLRRFLPRGVVGDRANGYLALNPFEVDGAAFGGLIGPVTDAARLAALHLGGGTLDGVSVLSADAVAEMARITTPGKPYDHGLGWFRHHSAGDPNHIEHLGGGAGFWNVIRLYPERGIGVVIMSNTTRRWGLEALSDRIVEIPWSSLGEP